MTRKRDGRALCEGSTIDGRGSRFNTRANCYATGKVQRDGKWYCLRHDPERIYQRRKESAQRAELALQQWKKQANARRDVTAARDALLSHIVEATTVLDPELRKLVDTYSDALARMKRLEGE